MAIPWMAGLGAALSQGAGDTLDERRRLRALQQAQAQMAAEQAHQGAVLDETKRHNSAIEALQSSQQQDARQSSLDLRRRQRIGTMADAGKGAGVNYLNPERAYEAFNPTWQQGFGDMGTSVPSAIAALSGASNQQTFLKGIEPTSQRLHEENRSGGFIPGSESIGGAYLENRNFNPYSSNIGRLGIDADENEGLQASRAVDDIQQAGASAYSGLIAHPTLLENIRPEQAAQLRQQAEEARTRAQNGRALFWSNWLSSKFPRNAHLYSTERLLGQMVAPTSSGGPPPQTQSPSLQPNPSGPPRQTPPAFDPNDPLGIGVPSTGGAAARPARVVNSVNDPLGFGRP